MIRTSADRGTTCPDTSEGASSGRVGRATPAWPIVLLCLGLTGGLFLRTRQLGPGQAEFAQPADHHKYIHMAEHDPFGFHIAPFCRRVGVPLLAKLIPARTHASFALLAFLAVSGTGIGLYALALSFGFRRAVAAVGVLAFFSLGWAAKFPLHNVYLPDAMVLLLVTLCILCCQTRRWLLLAGLLALGVTIKESVLLVAPMVLVLPSNRHRGALLHRIAAVLPALAVLAALHIGIPAWNDDPAYSRTLPSELRQVDTNAPGYGLLRQIRRIGPLRWADRSLSAVHAYSVGTFGALSLILPWFDARRNVRRLLCFLPFLALVYAQLFFATDTQRLLVVASPVVLVLALHGVDRLDRACGVRPSVMILIPSALFALNLLDPDRIAVPTRVEACVLGAGALVALATRQPRRAQGAGDTSGHLPP